MFNIRGKAALFFWGGGGGVQTSQIKKRVKAAQVLTNFLGLDL